MPNQTRRDFLRALGLGAAATVVPRRVWGKDAPKGPPNIVLIMSDDMGFSDIGCYGSEIRTPTLDKLAKGGLRFTQFYNTARCCPTRASLISGLYMHQAGIGHMMGDYGLPGYRGDLSPNCVTIAQALKTARYSCYMTGKWHVTKKTRPKDDSEKHNWPRQRGFDRFYGTIHGAGSFYDPNSLVRDNQLISPYADPQYKPKTYYYTDAISDHAARFINEHKADRPFFLYVAYTAAHWPMHGLEKDIAKYKGRYDGGWDKLRAERYQRTLEMGLIDRKWKLSPNVRPWESIKAKDRPWFARRMEVYAAMVDNMDAGIGRIVEALKRNAKLDNTLIFFLQDNGGCQEEFGSRGPVRPDPSKPVTLKPMKPTDLQFGMVPRVTRDGRPVRTGYGVMPGPPDTYIAYGIEWANASNTPFRRYKHYVHEGGIATPLIVHWPARVKAAGELRHQPGHLIDIMATCVDVAGATYPAEHKGSKITPMEGRSLVPAFDDKPIEREAIYWEHEGHRAVRRGKWKLVSVHRGPWELYDMEADRSELNDLAAKEPKIVAELNGLYEAWAKRCNVVPWGQWRRGRRRAKNVGSKKLSFDLKAGDDLPREAAPMIAGRSVAITATFTAGAGDGVIVAQGGSALGYALYVEGGKLTMAARTGGKLTVVTAPDKLPAGPVSVSARLAKDGTITLAVGGKRAASGKAPGPVPSQPADGLQVGRDEKGAVGQYQAPNAFGGKIDKLHIELGN